MAKTDIGPRISVEGESEYRKQMQRIVQQQKEYSAELSSTTAALGRNSSAQERSSAVGKILKKQIQHVVQINFFPDAAASVSRSA